MVHTQPMCCNVSDLRVLPHPQIVVHALCCYLDANLAPVPLLTEKTFSQQHFVRTPDKPGTERAGVSGHMTVM